MNGVSLNFEAKVDSKTALGYAYRGLFGKFKGYYHLKPFYANTKIYNNFEDRINEPNLDFEAVLKDLQSSGKI